MKYKLMSLKDKIVQNVSFYRKDQRTEYFKFHPSIRITFKKVTNNSNCMCSF